MFRSWFLNSIFMVSVLLFTGSSLSYAEEPVPAQPLNQHKPTSERGPSNGILFELLPDECVGEIVVFPASSEVHILARDLVDPLRYYPIPSGQMKINWKRGENNRTLELNPVPFETDPEGKSSRYIGKNEDLHNIEILTGRLVARIGTNTLNRRVRWYCQDVAKPTIDDSSETNGSDSK